MRTIHSKELFKDIKIPKDFFPPIIVAYNIKTPENIGNIIRLAGNSGCENVLFISDDDNVRNSKIKKTASSAYSSVNWEFCKENEIESKIPSDYKWIAIETTSDSKNIYQTKLPQKIAFIVGNEIKGIDSLFLDKCHDIVHIPLYGKTTSMNVSHALAVVLYECLRQQIT